MSGTVIVGSGGGHHAMRYLIDTYPHMTADEQADAKQIVLAMVSAVNERFNTSFDTTNL